ncbi:putative bifunctional diguanylate cyclase/phosphodiesterase [Catenovulum sediminis]|uniref:putative bifunctional diguanylate cyclase/phosphodiesterase n=1 Tax=Catenovulum sediminis TaxID=1740262 RepID=UPI00163DDF4C|nr:EAL domain-containing protein [Catenovulum sediminis]
MHSLKARVVLALVVSSLFATLLAVTGFSVVQYYKVHDQIQKDVEKNIELVSASLSEALWSFKEETVQYMASGLSQSQYIAATEVISETGERYLYGVKSGPPSLTQDLTHQQELVGNVDIWLDRKAINRYVIDSVLFVVSVYVVSAVLVSFIAIRVIGYMLSRHLSNIVSHMQSFKLDDSLRREIVLNRAPYIEDELSEIVNSYNRLGRETQDYFKAKRQYEKHLTYQANHDDLTGIANRRYGLHLLEEKIRSTSIDGKFALLFIDLDGFKDINDTHHHLVGDEILRIVSARLLDIGNVYGGFVARIGGDEFMLAVELDGIQLDALAKNLLQRIKEPYGIANDILNLSCSIGIAMYPEDADTATNLIANADTAMFQAKSSGKSQYKTFSAEMFEDLVVKSRLKAALKDALKNEQISVYFQPIFAIDDASIVGFEALCRWNHPEYGSIRPDIFIALAEETGDVVEIDRFVLEKVVKKLHKLEQTGARLFGTVNFCPLDFEQTDLIDHMAGLLERYPLTLNRLEVEVTERSMINESGNANIPLILQNMEKLGVKIAIDDFGTGYSALSYVKHYRSFISKIKVDRVFVRDIQHDTADVALVNSILSMAKGLGMTVVAEGIETEKQRDVLSSLGCQFGQGYLISKPLPIDEFCDLLNVQVDLARQTH